MITFLLMLCFVIPLAGAFNIFAYLAFVLVTWVPCPFYDLFPLVTLPLTAFDVKSFVSVFKPA